MLSLAAGCPMPAQMHKRYLPNSYGTLLMQLSMLKTPRAALLNPTPPALHTCTPHLHSPPAAAAHTHLMPTTTTTTAAEMIREPDGLPVSSLCAAANASEAWGAPAAAGWSDEHCDNRALPVMCRMQGGWGGGNAAGCAAPAAECHSAAVPACRLACTALPGASERAQRLSVWGYCMLQQSAHCCFTAA